MKNNENKLKNLKIDDNDLEEVNGGAVVKPKSNKSNSYFKSNKVSLAEICTPVLNNKD